MPMGLIHSVVKAPYLKYAKIKPAMIPSAIPMNILIGRLSFFFSFIWELLSPLAKLRKVCHTFLTATSITGAVRNVKEFPVSSVRFIQFYRIFLVKIVQVYENLHTFVAAEADRGERELCRGVNERSGVR